MPVSNKTSSSSIKHKKVLFSFILLIVFFVIIFQKLVRKTTTTLNTARGVVETTQPLKSSWVPYTNAEFKYTLSYPLSLTVVELKDKGGYLEFTRLEENGLTSDKGIAVGVRGYSLNEEVRAIQEDLDSEVQAKLISKKEVEVNGAKGLRLEYEPKDSSAGEKRTIVVLHKGGYSYSISTVPEQMDKVLEGFKLL